MSYSCLTFQKWILDTLYFIPTNHLLQCSSWKHEHASEKHVQLFTREVCEHILSVVWIGPHLTTTMADDVVKKVLQRETNAVVLCSYFRTFFLQKKKIIVMVVWLEVVEKLWHALEVFSCQNSFRLYYLKLLCCINST